jgi:hypothetical protein
MQLSSAIDQQHIQQANQAFHNQVSSQIARATAELKRLQDLLSFGMVDRRVLAEFRQAIDCVRTTGWQVERWLEGDERGLDVLLAQERVRVAARLLSQLAADAQLHEGQLSGVRTLADAVKKLDRVLDPQVRTP